MALSDRTGTIRMFVDGSNFGNGSLADANVPDRAGAVEVETTTLDEFMSAAGRERLDFIKMDTQGAEGLIVAGADRILSSAPMKMMLEFWPYGLKNVGTDPQALLEKLGDYGFSFQVIDPSGAIRPGPAPERIVADCESRAKGTGFVNLLLEK